MRLTRLTLCIAASLCLSVALPGAEVAHARDRPSLENLFQAKQLVLQTKARIAGLIQRIAGGGDHDGGGGGDQCGRFFTSRKCMAAGCYWTGNACIASSGTHGGTPDDGYPGWPHDGISSAREGDILENDVAANFALQGMGAGLERLAFDIDQAAATYNQPDFWIHWGQACSRATGLQGANQAAKVSANIPPPGFVTAADFIPIDLELLQVKALLMCL